MKLLFDQNLSHRLVEQLALDFPGSIHVRELGMASAQDAEIWAHAKAHKFVIVSKDTDFQQRALLYGHPPKVVWIRLGNTSTAQVKLILQSRRNELRAFNEDHEACFLAIS